MRVLTFTCWGLLLLFSLGLCFEQRAYAYIDPGSSLLVTQSLGAAGAATIFWFRKRIRQVFGRLFRSSERSTE